MAQDRRDEFGRLTIHFEFPLGRDALKALREDVQVMAYAFHHMAESEHGRHECATILSLLQVSPCYFCGQFQSHERVDGTLIKQLRFRSVG